jgi:hypothetical protein
MNNYPSDSSILKMLAEIAPPDCLQPVDYDYGDDDFEDDCNIQGDLLEESPDDHSTLVASDTTAEKAQALFDELTELFMLDSEAWRVIPSATAPWIGSANVNMYTSDSTVAAALKMKLYHERCFPKASFSVREESNPDIDSIETQLDHEGQCMWIRYPLIPVVKKDNQVILDWLKGIRPEVVEFEAILDWMAVYAYTNGNLENNLPIMILVGPRGSGKSTLAQVIFQMVPKLAALRFDGTSKFTFEYGKKLVLMDEVTGGKKGLYRTLKMIGGSEYLPVNIKYGLSYSTPNNLKVILTSNDPSPVDFVPGEMPTGDRDNQFLVCEFDELPQEKYIQGLQKHLEDHLGHFVRTLMGDNCFSPSATTIIPVSPPA